MKYIGRNLRAVLAIAVVATLAAISIPQPRPLAAAGSAPVMVTNTPLPVQGTVTVGNIPSVNVANAALPVQGTVNIGTMPNVNIGNVPTVLAQQSGAWNFSISGNSATSPVFTRDAENPASRPFQSECLASAASGVAFCVVANGSDIPVGSRLVVQEITGEGGFTSPVELRLTAGGKFVSHILQTSGGALTQQVTFYSDAGQDVIALVRVSGGAVGFTLSGHLVSVP